MSNFVTIVLYFIGLAVFGFFYWLMDGILDVITATNVQNTSSGTFVNTFDLMLYVWAGLAIVYLIFGGIWMIRTFEEGGTDTVGRLK